MHRSANACRYRLDYILRGDLNFEQHERVAPLLTAASSLLIVATDLGGLDHYQSGARILGPIAARTRIVGRVLADRHVSR